MQYTPNPGFLAGIDQCKPKGSLRFGKALQQQYFDATAAFLLPDQPCRKNFRIIQNQEIAGAEKIAELGKITVNNFAGAPLQDEQPRTLAPAAWNGRNQ